MNSQPGSSSKNVSSSSAKPIDRRSALLGILGLLGVQTLGIAALVGGFLSNAFGQKPKRGWIKVGKAEDLSTEGFQKLVLELEGKDAWMDRTRAMTVYVKDLYPKDPLAILSTCSHLGCSVAWKAKEDHFVCPCHGGTYDAVGKVVSGPPPRPLTHLETKVEGDWFYLRMPEKKGQSA